MPHKETLKRLGRLLSIIQELEHGPVKPAALSKRHGVRERAIQRDLELIIRSGRLPLPGAGKTRDTKALRDTVLKHIKEYTDGKN